MQSILIFTDAHYAPGVVAETNRYCDLSLKKAERILKNAAQYDMIINLGDLINGSERPEYDIPLYQRARAFVDGLCGDTPVCHVLGNHDGFAVPDRCIPEHKGNALGASFSAACGGFTFIFLDTNFYEDDFSYNGEEGDWTKSFLPQAQLDWLKAELAASRHAIVFLHQNADTRPWGEDGHLIGNGAAIRAVLEASGKVRAVFQGHYHPGYEQVIGGIPYVTLPALCFENRIAYMTVEADDDAGRVAWQLHEETL